MASPQAPAETASQRRRRRERDARIESILRAAQHVFFTKGYVRATMDEIALVAEVTKPTVYAYFPTKDDLFLSLMLPVIDDIGSQLRLVQQRLDSGTYETGAALVHDIVQALVHSHSMAPEAFKLVQLVQQTKMLAEFGETTRRTLDEGGRHNFETLRKTLGMGIDRGFLKPFGVYELADVIWGVVVGVIQVEDLKKSHPAEPGKERLARTLHVAEQIVIDAISRPAPSIKLH